MKIVTSCGHTIESAPKRYQQYINTGTTFDCPECGSLQVMMGTTIEFKSMNFHEWMNEKNPNWPVDGANTGYVEIEG